MTEKRRDGGREWWREEEIEGGSNGERERLRRERQREGREPGSDGEERWREEVMERGNGGREKDGGSE